MHIAFLIAPGGGPEAVLQTMLPWLEQRGCTISAVYMSPDGELKKPFPAHVRVVTARAGPLHYYLNRVVGHFHAWPLRLRAWEQAWAARQALRQIDAAHPVDVVEVVEGLPISPLRRLWPVVVHAHGSDWTVRQFCRDGDSSQDSWLIRQQSSQLRAASGVSAISRHLAWHLSESCRFPLDAIQVIPYPIDASVFAPALSAPSGPALLTVGRLERRKGVDVLVRALTSRAWHVYPDLKAQFVGRDSDVSHAYLRGLAPAHRRDQLVFPGFVNRKQLPYYYSQSTLYVAPTLYETFGYTVLEAMASGLAVIASRTGAIPELVEDGITGLLVPPGDAEALADALLTLLADPARRAAMGKRGRERAVYEYRPEGILESMLKFYQRALSA